MTHNYKLGPEQGLVLSLHVQGLMTITYFFNNIYYIYCYIDLTLPFYNDLKMEILVQKLEISSYNEIFHQDFLFLIISHIMWHLAYHGTTFLSGYIPEPSI